MQVNILEISAAIAIYPSRAAQIAALQVDKALSKIPSKYSNYADIFLPNLTMELPKHIDINNHIIKLENSEQPSYRFIYVLSLVKLMTLKNYIETYLKTGFI